MVGRWWGSFIGMPHVVPSLTPGGQCAQHCFSLQAISWSDRVKDKTEAVYLHRSPIFWPSLSLRGVCIMARWAPVLFLSLFVLSSPHSISISVTATLTTYQAAPIAWQATFWVVRIPFRCWDSYQSQRTWTADNFQPRAKYMCDWVRETGCLWRLLDFGRFLLLVWRIFLFTLAALSPVCLSV